MQAVNIERGDIYYVHKQGSVCGSEMVAGRPAVVVSNDTCNKCSPVIEVVYLTTQPKSKLPTHVVIESAPKNSIALCEQVTSVSTKRLGDYIGHVTPAEMEQLDFAICVSLSLASWASDPGDKDEKTAKECADEMSGEENTVVKLAAERNIYKAMYESLLDRVMEAR